MGIARPISLFCHRMTSTDLSSMRICGSATTYSREICLLTCRSRALAQAGPCLLVHLEEGSEGGADRPLDLDLPSSSTRVPLDKTAHFVLWRLFPS